MMSSVLDIGIRHNQTIAALFDVGKICNLEGKLTCSCNLQSPCLAINSPTPSFCASALDTTFPFLVKVKLSSLNSTHFEDGLMFVNLNG